MNLKFKQLKFCSFDDIVFSPKFGIIIVAAVAAAVAAVAAVGAAASAVRRRRD